VVATAVTNAGPRTLERAALEAIAYSDVFDYPLTAEEVWRFLPAKASRAEVLDALGGSPHVRCSGAFYTLPGREGLAAIRAQREADSAVLIGRARRYGALIARIPFVRMVAVTGALAAGNASSGDDIDLMLVTRPGRVWLARAMCMAVVRLAALRGLTLCPNFILAEDSLALADQSLYAARELVQMRPLAGFETYSRLLAANPWWRKYLPNAMPLSAPPAAPERPLVRRLAERALAGRIGDSVEGRVMRRKAAELRREAGDSPEAIFDASMCKGHVDAHGARVAAAYAERLALLEALP
jgi:hypothetical protein